jgi:hypothetical protein
MRQPAGRPFAGPFADRRFRLLVWILLGFVGWAGVAVVGLALSTSKPPKAGFDLELVLEAGRRVRAGLSPYAPSLVNGSAQVQAVYLFYSYPPPVAQAFAIFAGLPSAAVLLALGLLAIAGVALVADALGRVFQGDAQPSELVVPTLAVLPFLYPFAVALLFGNLDAFYPLAYGLLLIAMLAPSRGAVVGGGVALALVSVAKLHPALLGLWLLARGLRLRGQGAGWPVAWQILGVAAGTGIAILLLSLLVGGVQPWLDYASVLRTASGAGLVLASNIGPAAQVALLSGGGDALARVLQVPVLVGAILVAMVAAWQIADEVESLAWAAAASLIVLPITWFHYPAAMIPFAVAASARAIGGRQGARVGWLVAASAVVAVVSIGLPVLLWAAVALVLAAVRASRTRGWTEGSARAEAAAG